MRSAFVFGIFLAAVGTAHGSSLKLLVDSVSGYRGGAYYFSVHAQNWTRQADVLKAREDRRWQLMRRERLEELRWRLERANPQHEVLPQVEAELNLADRQMRAAASRARSEFPLEIYGASRWWYGSDGEVLALPLLPLGLNATAAEAVTVQIVFYRHGWIGNSVHGDASLVTFAIGGVTAHPFEIQAAEGLTIRGRVILDEGELLRTSACVSALIP